MDRLSREENWKSFCTHHAVGDWHGIFLTYSNSGEVVEKSRIIRSFYYIREIDQILHHNHYIHPNGQSRSIAFKNLNRDNCKAIYLDGSFTWGNQRFVEGTPMGSEIGFREGDRRVSASFIYAGGGQLREVYLIIERLMELESEEFPNRAIDSVDSKLQTESGTIQIVNSNWEYSVQKTSSSEIKSKLEPESEMLIISNNNIRLSCPKLIVEGSSFQLVLEWSEPAVLLRGIRHYSNGCFDKFELETLKFEQ